MIPFTLDEDSDKQSSPQETSSIQDKILFNTRNVLITGEINDKLAKVTTERLLALAAVNSDPINVFVSSPGGHVESGDMIHDIIQFIEPEVRLIGSGWVASAGALIFIAVEKKFRFCLPNTRFLLHQPSGGFHGQASDIAIQADELRIMKARFEKLFAAATGQSEEKIAKDTQRDFWLGVEEAKDYGILGTVIKKQSDIEKFLKRN